AQVRKAGRAGPVGHLLERRLTVAPIGMAMKGSREVLGRDQVGKDSLLGGFDLPRVLAQFGGALRQPERLEQIGLGAASDLAAVSSQRVLVKTQSSGQRPPADGDVVRFRSREVVQREGKLAILHSPQIALDVLVR